jgi:hypothetical protein
MKRKTIALATMMIVALITLSVTVPSAVAVAPYMTVDKSVSPTEIYLKGDGGMPDTATVIMSIEGAGDPIPGEETYAPTDVVVVFDDTGSMDSTIGAAKADIDHITDTLVAEIPDIRFGLVSYKDSADRDLALTSNVGAFRGAISALSASGGGGWREEVEGALRLGYASSWRSGDVAKVVILIGDAPAHNEAAAEAAATAAYADEYGIYTNAICVAPDSWGSSATTAREHFERIANNGQGAYSEAGGGAGVADAIIDSITTVVPSIDTAGEDVFVTEVVPSCIEASGFSPAPTTSAGSTHTWDFGKVGIGETKTITFDVKCTCAGDDNLVDVYPATALTYKAWDGTGFNTPTTKPFPETYIDCKVSNKPPVANAGPDQVVEQDSLGGASVTLDGSGSTDDGKIAPLTYTWTWAGGSATGVSPTVTLPMGTTTVTLTVYDGQYTDTDTVDITVQDTTPPVITASGEQIVLWPPNHKYRTVEIFDCDISVTDICDADVGIDDIEITSVSSDEPEDAQGKGDGNTEDDIVIVDSQTVELRAERQGGGNGRVYTINFGVTDASGNTETGSCTVWVLHDQESDSTAIDDGADAGYTVNYP